MHIGKSIRVVGRQADTLGRLAPEWGDLYEDERIDFAMEWSNTMCHLRTVEEAHRGGDLSAAQEREYAPVRRRVRELLPTIERLNLGKPLIPLD